MNHFIKQKTFLACLFASSSLLAQTTIYTENFNGASHGFTLNTGDASSTASPASNQWLVNNSYTGGSGSVTCLGFPFSFTAGTTPSQPAGISGNPTSKYLHICSFAGQNSGFSNCTYLAADGFCNLNEYNFAKMSSDISTVGYSSVDLSFWWLCGGESGANYGEVYYSTNGGSSWTVINTPISQYVSSSNWTQQTISLPAFANQATLRFGFRFVNETAAAPEDPAFGIDDVTVVGTNSVPLSTSNVSGTMFCPGDAISVDYSSSATFTAGNVFTAQLSDLLGSFAAPVAIGTLSSTNANGTINGTIPANTPAGAGYRVRVVSSAPSAIGSDNGTNIGINPAAVAGQVMNNGLDTICPGEELLLQISAGANTVSWQSSDDGISFQNTGVAGAANNFYPMQSTWYRAIVSNTCGSDTSAAIYIHVRPTPVASFNYSQNGSSLQITFTNNTAGTFTSSDWDFGDGFGGSQTNPSYSYAAAGTYVVTLVITATNGCTSTFIDTITVAPINGISDNLMQNTQLSIYPNPNNGSWTSQWEWASAGDVQLSLFDLQGHRLQTLFDGFLPAGSHQIACNAPAAIAEGIYILQIQTPLGIAHQKVAIRNAQ